MHQNIQILLHMGVFCGVPLFKRGIKGKPKGRPKSILGVRLNKKKAQPYSYTLNHFIFLEATPGDRTLTQLPQVDPMCVKIWVTQYLGACPLWLPKPPKKHTYTPQQKQKLSQRDVSRISWKCHRVPMAWSPKRRYSQFTPSQP